MRIPTQRKSLVSIGMITNFFVSLKVQEVTSVYTSFSRSMNWKTKISKRNTIRKFSSGTKRSTNAWLLEPHLMMKNQQKRGRRLMKRRKKKCASHWIKQKKREKS